MANTWEKLRSTNPEYNTTTYFDKLFNANGLYRRSEIDLYNQIYRFGRMNYQDALQDTREFLFFTKPDLHIMNGKTGKLNFELSTEPFFMELASNYPNIISQLQTSADKNNNPISTLLCNTVMGNLDVPQISSTTIDTPSNIYGTSYEYVGSSEASDDNFDFSLEFKDSKYLDTYMYFKAYSEYQMLKRHGRVSPPDIQKYVVNKVLHDQIGIFKIITDSDLETIVYYAYYCGVMIKSLPRDVFSNTTFSEGLSYSIDFKAAFVEDMNPLILRDFNSLTSNYRNSNTTKDLPIYDISAGMMNGTPAKSAYITTKTDSLSNRKRYKLIWRV